MSSCYLLHFDRGLPHGAQAETRHYLGFSTAPEERIAQHFSGEGARLMQVLYERGITFTVARIWNNCERKFERRLKSQGGLSRHCPICLNLGLIPTSRARSKALSDVQPVPKTMQPKTAAGAVDIDWETGMFENYKLVPKYSYHEYGDPIDEDEAIGELNWNMLVVSVFDTAKEQRGKPGKQVGEADFVLRGGRLESANTEVDKSYWRRGIATALYQYAESLTGFKTKPHSTQSPEGRALWQQGSRPFGKSGSDKPMMEMHRKGAVVWIDWFEVPASQQGKGLGRKYYEAWEQKLPKNVKLVRLFAGNTDTGEASGFWAKMGFENVFYDEESQYSFYMWKGVNGNPTPPPMDSPDEDPGYDVEDEPEKTASKTAANRVSGEDVVAYVMKLNEWDRDTAYQVVGPDAGGDYVLRDFPLSKLSAGDDYDPEQAEQYSRMEGPLPPIVLGLESRAHRDKPEMVTYYVIRDGNHRVAAAKLRGDSKIKAYVPADATKVK